MKSNNNSRSLYIYIFAGIAFLIVALLSSSLDLTFNSLSKKIIILSVDYTNIKCSDLDSGCHIGANVDSPPENFIHFGFGNYLANQAKLTLEKSDPQGQFLRIDSNPFTLAGESSLDHVKYLMLTNRSFDLPVAGSELVCKYNVRLQTFNTNKHPFGSAIYNADQDLRLAAAAVNSLDFGTNIVADFLLTNNQIYVVYERLPFAGPDYAAFTFAIPVRTRQPNEFLELSIAWDFEHKIVRWLIDNREVYRVSTVGYLISREYLIIDRGGREELVFPKSVQCGGGTFTLLDGSTPCIELETTSGGGSSCAKSAPQGLVQLDFPPSRDYLTPKNGQTKQSFIDPISSKDSKIYGQGAILDIKYIQVYTQSNKNNI